MLASRSRRPAVAGYFYPGDAETLRDEVDRTIAAPGGYGVHRATALVVPHGSFRHAGGVFGAAFRTVRIPQRCLVVAPSHTRGPLRWSIMSRGAYRTPLGEVPVDTALAEAVCEACTIIERDPWGQPGEHAIEVLLPFLQRCGPTNLRLVPLVTTSDDLEECQRVGRALSQIIARERDPVLLIASTDLSQYVPRDVGMEHDRRLMDAICALDTHALIRHIEEHRISMCGYGPVITTLEAVRQLGATTGQLLAYGTSEQAGGDPGSVTGYAAIMIN